MCACLKFSMPTASRSRSWYCDYFKRDNKNGGAWMDVFVNESKLLGLVPVVFNVANFSKPAPGQPALISFDDVTTMFHEFGHALHGMFANTRLSEFFPARKWRATSSSSHRNSTSIGHSIRQCSITMQSTTRSGVPMPAELVAKIRKSEKFNGGYDLTEVVAAAQLDMQWHTLVRQRPAAKP
jgi:peptidyl-dipeptidase Dcp